MKKALSLLLIITCLISTCTLAVAESTIEFTIGEKNETKKEAAVVSFTGEASTVSIPSEIDGYKIVKVYSDFMRSKNCVKKLMIPASVTDLDSIPLTGGKFCEEIYVDEANPVYASKNGVLYNKDYTVLVRCPEGYPVKCFTVESGVKTIGIGAFDCYYSSDKDNLTEIVFPDTLTYIDSYAFEKSRFKEIILPDSVRYVASTAFLWAGVEYMHFGSNIPKLDPSFFQTSYFKEFSVSGENANYMAQDGVLYSKDASTLVCYPPSKEGTKFKLPDSVTTVAGFAFYTTNHLEEIDFNKAQIYQNAFIYNGLGIEKVTFPACAKSIDFSSTYVFTVCKEITFLSPTVQIKYSDVRFLGSSPVTIKGYKGSTAQTMVEALSKEANLVFQAIDEQTKLGFSITPLNNTQARIDSYTGYETELTVPEEIDGYKIVSIGNGAFQNNTTIQKITFPQTLEKIEAYALKGLDLVETLTIPKSVKSIGYFAGYSLAALKRVRIESYDCTFSGMFFPFNNSVAIFACSGSSAQQYFKNKGYVFYSIGHQYISQELDDGTVKNTCSICGYYEISDNTGQQHLHQYKKEIIPPTCTQGGYALYTCEECDYSYTAEWVDATGHSFVIDVAVAPSCTATGWSEGEHCALCGLVKREQEPIEKIPHRYDSGTLIKQPNCTENGIKRYTCEICKNYYDESLPYTGHSYASQVIVRNSTCTKEGVKRYTCILCGDSYTEALPLLSHTYDKGKIIRNSNCSEHGIIRFTCKVCSAHKDESLPLNTQHSYNSGVIIKASTCKTQGIKRFTCLRCKAVYDKKLPLSAVHRYDAGVLTKKPTCTAKGITTYTCKVCGAKKTAAVKAKGHSYNSGVVTKKSTCTAAGNKRYTCKVCKAVKDVRLAKAAHRFTSTVTKAGFSKNGTVKKYCKVCKGAVTKQTIYKVTSAALSKVTYTYTGSAISKPGVTLKNSQGQKLASKYYTLTYYSRSSGTRVSSIKAIGQYKAKVSLKGNYSGTKYLYFSVGLRAIRLGSVTPGKKSITVKWKADSSVSGYQVMLAENASFSAGVKTAMVNSSSTASCQFVNLKAGKVYYVKLRAFKDIRVDGRSARMYSGYTGSKSAKAK